MEDSRSRRDETLQLHLCPQEKKTVPRMAQSGQNDRVQRWRSCLLLSGFCSSLLLGDMELLRLLRQLLSRFFVGRFVRSGGRCG